MDNPSIDRERSRLEIDKNEYLKKIKPEDRTNIETITALFLQTMQQLGRSGVLIAVGSSLSKTEYHDIDLVIALNPKPSDPVLAKFPNRLEYACAEMKIISGLVVTMIQQNPNFRLDRIILPYPDHQFNDPSMLAHEGSIVIANDQQSVPIEFIRVPITSSTPDALNPEERPFSILATIST